MKFDIKHRYSDRILYTGEGETLAAVVEKAVLVGANLVGANLARANLAGASLVGANLARANLDGASLVGANLDGADLARAYLVGANLVGANLVGANLDGAYLVGANLDGANLVGANLARANLDGANLARAYLDDVKKDFYEILSASVAEIPGLLSALREGRVDGSTYKGECACLVGTIANIRKVNYESIDGIKPDCMRPAEKWFMAIRRGSTPGNNAVAKITEGWIEEFIGAL